ncbi:hypothetical protein UB47_01845 [Pseudomonas sp. 5]|nr:hypothetical protein UB47_01845 [Pseudomonas sp. 5]
MQLIAKQMERREQAQAPAPDTGVGAAIENMIADEVERRVSGALAEQRRQLEASRPKPTYSDFKQIPPPPRTPTPKAMSAQIQRDGAGLARAIVINGVRFLAQRDAAGQLIGMVSEDQASEVSYNGAPVPPAPFNRGV